MEYNLSAISPKDDRACRQMDALLEQEGIRRDGHLDYMCGLFDEEGNLVATGSCFGNTLRCFATSFSTSRSIPADFSGIWASMKSPG